MDKFKELVDEMEVAKVEADKLYINENMQAGKRLFASLMRLDKKGKEAREELSSTRKVIRKRREEKNGIENL